MNIRPPDKTQGFGFAENISLPEMLEELKPHDHIGLIYETCEDWRAAVAPFIAIGLHRKEKCIYFFDTNTADEIRRYLIEEGIDVTAAEQSGQLFILNRTEAHTMEDLFDPERMVALLIDETEKAVSDGYTALRITAEMTWMFHSHPDSEKLLGFDAKLNRDFFPNYPCLAMCQYDRWKFDPDLIKDIIMTHPLLVRGGHVYRNFYYIPTDEFNNTNRTGQEIQHWFNNLEKERCVYAALLESEVFNASLLENSPDPVFVINPDGSLRYANPALEKLTGFTSVEIIGKKQPRPWWIEGSMELMDEIRDRLPKGGQSGEDILFRKKNGERFWVNIKTSLIESKNKLSYILVNWVDITERKLAEEKIEHLNLTLRAIRNVNQLISQEKNRDRLLEGVCRNLVETRGYSGTWLVLTDNSDKPVAHSQAGWGNDFMRMLEQWNAGVVPACAQKALARPDIVVTEKTLITCNGCPLLYNSDSRALTVNLTHAGKIYGLLHACIPAAFVTDEEIDLFRELAADCAFALYSIEVEEERRQAEAALQESEKFSFSLLENAPNPVIVLNPDSSIRYVSPSMERLTGYTAAELIGKKDPHPWWIEGMDQNTIAILMEKLAENRHTEEHILQKKNGERFCVSANSIPVEHNGVLSYILVNWVDITGRKQIEENLRESKEFSANLLENAPNPVIVLNPDSSIHYVNPALEKLTGYTSIEVIGIKPPFPWWIEGSKELIDKIRNRLPKGGQVMEEILFRKKNGEHFWVNINTALVDSDGTMPYFLVNWVDITERKRVEEALKESQEHITAIRKSIPDLIITLDEAGRYMDILSGEGELLYAEKGKVIGRFLSDVLPRDIADAGMANIQQALETGKTQTMQYQLAVPAGERWFEGKISPVISDDSRGKLVVMVARDITERKKLEEEQQRVAKLESIGTLAGGIAHDFNNILTGVIGNISLIQRLIEPGSEIAEKLDEVEKASLRAKDLTHRLLTFARGGAPIKKTISVTDLILESASFAVRGSNIRCEYSFPDYLWPVEADEGQLNQAFTNLVINAVEAMPMGGMLNISAGNQAIKKTGAIPLSSGNFLEITLTDSGIGISKAHLDRIFEPYFTTKQRGSGLGLATTYSIIKNHDGYITVESELGVGTTFRIYLPASAKPAPVKEKAQRKTPITGKGRILVMDDEEAIRLLLGEILVRAGYEAELSSDGEDAIRKYSAAMEAGKPFAGVIMDLTIPGGMGGKETIDELRKIDPEVKAIVSSGYSTDPVMADYREYGFSGIVAKPYQTGEIERVLQIVLLGPD